MAAMALCAPSAAVAASPCTASINALQGPLPGTVVAPYLRVVKSFGFGPSDCDALRIVGGSSAGGLWAWDNSNGLWKSTDDGSTWTRTYTATGYAQIYNVLKLSSGRLLILVRDSSDLYHVLRSTDATGTSFASTPVLNMPAQGTLLASESWVEVAGAIYVGEYGDAAPPIKLWKSTDDGQTFSVVFELSGVRHFHSVQADPYVAGRIWVCIGDNGAAPRVGYSDDGGHTFTFITQGLYPVSRVVTLMFDQDAVYWGTDTPDVPAGLYRYDRQSHQITSLLSGLNGPYYYGFDYQGIHVQFSGVAPSDNNYIGDQYYHVLSSNGPSNWSETKTFLQREPTSASPENSVIMGNTAPDSQGRFWVNFWNLAGSQDKTSNIQFQIDPSATGSIPPSATTDPATAITTSGATLNGRVSANGWSTTVRFEYGTTTSYGSQTADQSTGSATSAQAFAASVSGLQAATTYHFRVVATSEAGTTNGADQTFTTAASPGPSVTTDPATGVTGSGATVNGTVNPNGSSTTARFEYGTTTAYGAQTADQSVVANLVPNPSFETSAAGWSVGGTAATTFARQTGWASVGSASARYTVTVPSGGYSEAQVNPYITGIQPGVQYTARATVNVLARGSTQRVVLYITWRNAAGNGLGKSELANTKLTGIRTLSGTAVAPVGAVQAQVVVTVENAGLADLYFDDAQLTSGGASAAAPISAGLTGLAAGTTYHYRVVATNTAGTNYGADRTFTTDGAPPPPPPSATTDPATGVTSAGATLNGTVNPNGSSTAVRFEYGTTTLYGSQTADQAAGSGTVAQAFAAAVSGLQPSTTYHFRVVATTALGPTYGADRTFTTAAAPPLAPSATTDLATSITTSGATLNGTVNPNGVSTAVQFEYGTSTSYGSQTASQSAGSGSTVQAMSAAVSGLQPSTTYHCRVVASSTGGTTYGADRTFTTDAAPPLAPSATTDPATAITTSAATLNGTVNPNGVSTSVQFEYGTSTSYGSQTASQSAGSGSAAQAMSAAVSGLQPSTTYHYRVVASSAGGTTNGSDRTFTTDAAPPLAPSATTDPATAITTSAATLNGTVNPNGVSTSVQFEYGTSTSYGSQTASQSAGSGSTVQAMSAAVSGLQPSTTYHYRVVASSTGGTTYGADRTFTTDAPPPPPSATTDPATAITQTGATLNGTVNPNGVSTTVRFEYGTTTLYGSQSADQAAGSGSAAQAFAASVSGLAAGTTYHFRVVATTALGPTNGSDRTFTTDAAPPLAPSATTDLATSITTSGATLNGTVNPNGVSTAVQFEYGTSTSYGSQTASQSAGSGSAAQAFAAAVSGLQASTTYHYRVVATSAGGTTNGADRTFTTDAAPPPSPSATTDPATGVTSAGATLNGTVNPNGSSTTVRFEYGTTALYGSQTADQAAGAGASGQAFVAAVSGLQPSTTYHYRVVASSAGGTTNGSDRTFTTDAAPPLAPSATTDPASAITQTGATLNGTVNPNGSSTTVQFQYGTTTAYGSQTADQAAGAGASGQAFVVAVSGLQASTTYHYRVVATSAGGTTNGADRTFTTDAAPPPSPSATTDPATAITQTGATLNGTVNPNGSSTTVRFEYGTTALYGSQTPDQSVAANLVPNPSFETNITGWITGGTAPTTFARQTGWASAGSAAARYTVTVPASGYSEALVNPQITGIQAGVRYAVRADVNVLARGATQRVVLYITWRNATGGSLGKIQAASTNLTGVRALSGSLVAPVGAVRAQVVITVENAGLADLYFDDVRLTVGTVSASLTGLQRATTYHYRVVATNAGGTTNGADRTFTTAP